MHRNINRARPCNRWTCTNPAGRWLCMVCNSRLGIDLFGVAQRVTSLKLNQPQVVCLNGRSLEALDLKFDDFMDRRRWLRILKSECMFKESPFAKQQLDAMGLLDAVLMKHDGYFKTVVDSNMKCIDVRLFLKHFMSYIHVTKQKFSDPSFNVAFSIRKILQLMRQRRIFHYNEHDSHFGSVIKCLLAGITGYCSGDSDLVIEFIETLCFSQYYRYNFFNFVENTKNLEFLLSHVIPRKFNFWGFYNRRPDCKINPIGFYIERKRYDMVEVMLRYGFTYGFQRQQAFVYSNRIINNNELRLVRSNNRSSNNWRQVRSSLLLVIYSILATFSDPQRTNKDVKMLQLLFSDYTFAYPRPELFRTFIRFAMKPEYLGKYLQACNEYETSILWSKPHREPRSLVELSRTAIRDRLRKNYQLPYGILDLNVPTTLKTFLNLDQKFEQLED